MTTRILTAALLLAITPFAMAASGDIEAGKTKAQMCQSCHGEDGNGVGQGDYPLLAGQHADYLFKALTDYKSGRRNNPIMAGFAATLSEQDMHDLAAYFASQTGPLSDLSALK